MVTNYVGECLKLFYDLFRIFLRVILKTFISLKPISNSSSCVPEVTRWAYSRRSVVSMACCAQPNNAFMSTSLVSAAENCSSGLRPKLNRVATIAEGNCSTATLLMLTASL